MEVILLQKVANLGNIGDKVKVKPGYGRNFLLPSGKAALATAAEPEEVRRAPRGVRKDSPPTSWRAPQTRAKQLEGFKLNLQREGRHRRQAVRLGRHADIAEALTKAGIAIERSGSAPAGRPDPPDRRAQA